MGRRKMFFHASNAVHARPDTKMATIRLALPQGAKKEMKRSLRRKQRTRDKLLERGVKE